MTLSRSAQRQAIYQLDDAAAKLSDATALAATFTATLYLKEQSSQCLCLSPQERFNALDVA